MSEVILIYALALGFAVPLGFWLARALSMQALPEDRLFAVIERPIYAIAGMQPDRPTGWQGYAMSMLRLHLVIGTTAYLLLVMQGWLPFNPDEIPGMSWDLALHTTASFITNTNQQHYSGQAQLSYLAHTFGIVGMQVITPAAGIAAAMAIVRTLFAVRGHERRDAHGRVLVGHFGRDLVRTIVRVLLPLACVVAVILASQGVPSTLEGAQTAQTLDDQSGLESQRIPVGPVAPMVAIKQLATNGGGWYGPNSSVPLENPTPLSNLVECALIIMLPAALVVMVGAHLRRARLAVMILGVMTFLSFSLGGLAIWSENQPNAAFEGLAAEGPNMEGKEVRFGPTASALWGSFTTQTSNGSVNSMHDSFNPGGGVSTLMGMFINATYGGVGVGLINYLLFLLLAVFLGSLMIGRSPEIMGRALETREMKLVSIALILQPIMILGFVAMTLAMPSLAGNSNPAFHGLSQVLYEYTSAFANNGSGFEGLGDDSVWWNVTCAINLVIGRFLPILAPLAVAASIASKRSAPTGEGSLSIESSSFALLTIATIVLFALLSFMPVLVLGPLAEALTLAEGVGP